LATLTLLGELPGDGRWATDVGNFSHAPVFAVITVGLSRLLRRPEARAVRLFREYLLVFAGALLLGCLIELAQLLSGRDASAGDLGRDMLGTLAAIGLLLLADQRVLPVQSGRAVRTVGAVAAVLAIALSLAPLLITASAYSVRQRQFPALTDFSTPAGTYFLGAYGQISIERAGLPVRPTVCCKGDIGLKARVASGRSWALAIWEPKPDWRDYRAVAFDIVNPTDAELVIEVRLRYRQGTRNSPEVGIGEFHVGPRTRQTTSLPLHASTGPLDAHRIDFSAVRGVVLANSPHNRADQFYLMKAWLE
jgi:hypothetical protein